MQEPKKRLIGVAQAHDPSAEVEWEVQGRQHRLQMYGDLVSRIQTKQKNEVKNEDDGLEADVRHTESHIGLSWSKAA